MAADKSTADLWWMPVVALDELACDRPKLCARMGVPLVIWHGGASPQVLDDRCPHRGARLSLGRVCEGQVECPYHLWRFDGDGRCTYLPPEEAERPAGAFSVRAWAACVAHGMVWVAPRRPPGNALQAPPALPALPRARVRAGPRHLPVSAARAVDAFLSSGNFGAALDEGYRHDTVLGPYTALITVMAPDGTPARAWALWACADSEVSCRVWFTVFDGDCQVADETLLRAQQARVDRVLPRLHALWPRRLPLAPSHGDHSVDDAGAGYRQWLHDHDFKYGVC